MSTETKIPRIKESSEDKNPEKKIRKKSGIKSKTKIREGALVSVRLGNNLFDSFNLVSISKSSLHAYDCRLPSALVSFCIQPLIMLQYAVI